MKTRLLLLLSVFCMTIHAQNVKFDFDTAGNFTSVHIDNLLVESSTPIEKITAVLGKPSLEYIDSGNFSIPVQREGKSVTKWKYKHFVFSSKGMELIQDVESGLWQELAVIFQPEKNKPEIKKFNGTLMVNNKSLSEKENRNQFLSGKTNKEGWYSVDKFVYRQGLNSKFGVEFGANNKAARVSGEWNPVKIKQS